MSKATVDLSSLFDKFKVSKIFKRRELLLPDYVPSYLPHRDQQIYRLGLVLAPILSGSRPSNVFIYGLTGTGKTAVTKYVLRELKKKAGNRVTYAYVNCRHTDTSYRVIAELAQAVGQRVPFTGLSTSEVFRRFIRGLERRQRFMLVVLDEIDYLVKKKGDDVLYFLTRINDQLSISKVSIIGITNDLRFMDFLDARVRSSLGEEELVFPPYTSRELEDILRMRAEQAFHSGVLEEEVIPLCAAIAARQNGDCRLALDLLLKAADIAERLGELKVKTEHVRMAQKEIEKNLAIDLIKSMPLHVKLVLAAILILHKKKIKVITTGSIYNRYVELAQRIGVEPVTQRRVSDIINELDMLGVINAQVVSLGRYGRTKRIKLSVSESSIKEGLKEDFTLGDLWIELTDVN
ncbi:MAG: cell division control protein Cdc6 [Thermoprotei archaeon]|nr:MAG: cell division control protein Cdc6 [Thermoprotei archaeon]